MTLRRRKSRAAKVAGAVGGYLKLKAVGRALKGARKAAKGTAAYQVAKRTPRAMRAIPVVAVGAGVATVVAVKKLRGGDDTSPAAA